MLVDRDCQRALHPGDEDDRRLAVQGGRPDTAATEGLESGLPFNLTVALVGEPCA